MLPREVNEQVCEIDIAKDHTDRRHDDTLDQRSNDPAECSADYYGDGQISEYLAAPQHLALGGFITGSYNGTTDFMTSAQGGAVYIYNDAVGGRTGNGIRFDNLPDSFAQQVDAKLDDGVATTGSVRATTPYTANGASTGAVITRTAIFF